MGDPTDSMIEAIRDAKHRLELARSAEAVCFKEWQTALAAVEEFERNRLSLENSLLAYLNGGSPRSLVPG